MAANHGNLWNWDYENFRLDSDFPMAIPQSVWDEWEHSLLASTPSSQIIQQPQLSTLSLYNEGITDISAATSTCYRDFYEESPICKRRRMLLFPGDEATHYGNYDYESMRSCSGYDLRSICESIQLPESTASSLWFSDDQILCPKKLCQEKFPEQEGLELKIDGQTNILPPPFFNQQENKAPVKPDLQQFEEKPSINRPSLEGVGVKKINTDPLTAAKKKDKLATPVLAYPFAVLKPSGVEGDVTLNDINKRILMPPKRPIQHPVGDYAKIPSAASTGSGLSGKAVVALTKIHTQGKGTITIMRTKG
ncbi:hypothetical protein SUGI_0793980 [Cryptomeria japonica]|uniref:protein XRI1 n=1 Tax=Cryptomeria japonica TaxID=3369 RepID=UPI0024147D93|nr:protein XRI1 [Cryptomeria japonica]GLJ38944.1 hypothetical protein SUGI_0793980 [Cryptomeria japonica]